MTIEIALIPDGRNEIPRELLDDEIIALHLQKLDIPKQAPINSWKEIHRLTYGNGSKLVLRIEGITMSDISDTLLEKLYQAITSPTTGVKPHPDGWHNVDEQTRPKQ